MTFTPSDTIVEQPTAPPFEPFLMNPGNRAFFEGKTHQLVGAEYWKLGLFAALEGFAVIAVVYYVGLSSGLDAQGKFLLLVLCMFLAALYMYRVWRSRIRFAIRLPRDGHIIQGVLTNFQSEFVEQMSEGVIDGYYWTKVSYSFLAPSGHIEGESSAGGYRDPQPEPGTPVAIIYLDDKHYLLL